MQRYWRIYKTFFISSFARELEFRANFFAKIAQNAIWIGFFVLILLVIYRNTDSVAGWSRGAAFILAATCFLMNSVHSALFFSLNEIPEQVRKGTLDFVITKPIDTQFWVSSRKFNFDQIGTLVAGVVMVVKFFLGSEASMMTRLLAESLAGVATYSAAMFLLFRDRVKRFRKFLGSARERELA